MKPLPDFEALIRDLPILGKGPMVQEIERALRIAATAEQLAAIGATYVEKGCDCEICAPLQAALAAFRHARGE